MWPNALEPERGILYRIWILNVLLECVCCSVLYQWELVSLCTTTVDPYHSTQGFIYIRKPRSKFSPFCHLFLIKLPTASLKTSTSCQSKVLYLFFFTLCSKIEHLIASCIVQKIFFFFFTAVFVTSELNELGNRKDGSIMIILSWVWQRLQVTPPLGRQYLCYLNYPGWNISDNS